MILESFKMLNQYAVEIPTLPVNQCLSHLIQFLVEYYAVLEECRAAKTGRQAFGTHGKTRHVFYKSSRVFFSNLSEGIESMEFWHVGINSLINGEPIQIVSQEFPHLQRRRLFKEFWCRPTTTADFWSPLWQIPCTSNVCFLEDKIQDWGMYLLKVYYGSYALDHRSGIWLIQWMI